MALRNGVKLSRFDLLYEADTDRVGFIRMLPNSATAWETP
jgi:hypothetical protein